MVGWLRQQTVSSLDRRPLFSVLYTEVPLYVHTHTVRTMHPSTLTLLHSQLLKAVTANFKYVSIYTTGTQLAVLYTVEILYRGHHWDPFGCSAYSGTSLKRTPLGPNWLSCIQWNLSIEDTTGTQLVVLYTVEPLYKGHHWDPAGCPVHSGTSL